VAEFIHRGVGIAKEINATASGKKLADFKVRGRVRGGLGVG
tara:strand:- start:26 stop:148 length:123 start_codon:yes stop_codon:yes gene_type:complete